MSFIRIFFIVLSWQITGFSQVSGSGNIPKPESVVNSTGKLIKNILDKFPESNIKNGLKEYLEILGHEKYYSDKSTKSANRGIASYLSSRFSDPTNSCVRDAALSFYKDIAHNLKKNFGDSCTKRYNLISSTFDYGCLPGRANLLDVTGKEPYENLKPGWIWELALKHAKGDPNSAMFLIGLCGHDDAAQGDYIYFDSSPKALEEIQIQKMSTIEDKKKIDLQIKELSFNYDKNQEEINNLVSHANNLNHHIKTLSTQSTLSRSMACPPQASGFHTPQGLDSKADISLEVKNEIQNIQGKIGGAKNIPAKYYHVYGSAFMACQLIQNGMSPSMANIVQQQAARLYRGFRMCQYVEEIYEQVQQQAELNDPLFRQYKVKNETELVLSIIKNIKQKRLTCKDFPSDKSAKECMLLNMIGYLPTQFEFDQSEINESAIREKIEGRKRNWDAAQLYRKWYFGGGKVLGQKIPCSDIRILGPSDLLKPTEGFFKLQNELYKPKGWTDSQYKIATQKLATWDVDFKWTIAQHAAGAEFAGKVCKKRGQNEKPLKGICPNGPPEGKIHIEPGDGNISPNATNPEAKGSL